MPSEREVSRKPIDVVAARVSVVVCTYNRLPLLKLCLDALIRQTIPAERFEIVVVDNNCSDGTDRWLSELARTVDNLRFVRETEQGLSHARNRGWRESRGSHVAFLDDDGIPGADWMEGIVRTLAEEGEDLAAFGSSYFPFYLASKPRWFADRYGAWDGGDRVREYVGAECICGGNMVVRRDVLAELGGFSGRLGMKGNRRAFAEESLVHMRIKRSGKRSIYSPYFPIRHLVKESQYRARDLLRDSFRSGWDAASIRLSGDSKVIGASKVAFTVLLSPYYLFRNFPAHPVSMGLDLALPFARRLGYFLGLFRPRIVV